MMEPLSTMIHNRVVSLAERIAEVKMRREINTGARELFREAGATGFDRFDRIEMMCDARIAVLTEGLRITLNAAA